MKKKQQQKTLNALPCFEKSKLLKLNGRGSQSSCKKLFKLSTFELLVQRRTQSATYQNNLSKFVFL